MKVWIVTHVFSLNDGQGHVNYEIAQYLADQGHQVCLVATEAADELVNHPNIQFFQVVVPAWLKVDLLRNQFFALKVSKLLRQQVQPLDIVHLNGSIAYYPADVNASHFVHSSWLKSDYHPFRLRPWRLRSLYQLLYNGLNAVWEKRAYRVARHTVAVSEFVQSSLIKDCGTNPDQIHVIWNGVDNEVFRPLQPEEPNQLRCELDLASDSFISIFIGDLKTNRKNLDLVLHALTQLPDSIHLAVVGKADGSIYPAMAASLGIENRVHFLGYRRDIPKLFRGADAFAFPSNYDPASLVVLEAMASGLPLITTCSVGNSALVEHDRTGFVLEHNDDLVGLVKTLGELATDAQLAHTVGTASRLSAEAYGWKIMAKQYLVLYQKILREKKSGKVHQADLVSA